ncbi:MAG: Omp28-related outer membrane protein [Prevotella sp.]|nr:Omp28-related outer membrane protein [Prevotella sp.]
MHISKIDKMLACALLLLCGSTAQAASVIVGLCGGTLGTAPKSKPGSGEISAACILPKSLLADYAGMKITKMRVGIATNSGFTDMHCWVRTALTANDLGSASLTTPAVGWNEVTLSEPVTIPAGQDLAIGYSFTQSKSCKTILLAGEDEDDDYLPAYNGCWIGKNGSWENYSEHDGYDGSPCAEIVIEDGSLPAKNLKITAIQPESRAVAAGDSIRATVTVSNLGEESIKGYTCAYNINGQYAKTLSRTVELGQNGKDILHVSLPTSKEWVGTDNKLNLEVSGEGSTATAQERFAVYDSTLTYPHEMLLEEFSTENCPNCPRAIETFAQMDKEGFAGHYHQITHHCGYTSDYLTVAEDKDYTWLYGNEGTYAPAAMFDRTYVDGFPKETKMPVPVFQVGFPDDIRPLLKYALAWPAFVKVTPEARYNEQTRQLDVTVRVEKNHVLDFLCPSSRLSVILTEDSVKQHEQAGYSSTTFRHRHVYRQTLSALWGDTLKWNGNVAEMHYSMTVPEVWTNHEITVNDNNGKVLVDSCNARNLEVVAFVNEYNAQQRSACRVFNSGSFALKSITDGIRQVSDSYTKYTVTTYYTPDGIARKGLQKGLNIVVSRQADGNITVKKIGR